MKLEVSTLVAVCLQRMIVDEIDNQEYWKIEDKAIGARNDCRDKVIKEMKQLADDLEKQGIPKHFKCY